VIVDGNCRALKAEFRTVMEDELLNQTSCRLVNEQLDKLSAAGYKQQAFPRDINLFYLDVNSRERIVLESTTFKVHPPAGRAGNSNKEFSKEEILAELEQFPERFSPNVILRPIFQQKILPSLAYIGGGGELSYWLQLKTLFEHFRVNFLRNSVLYINSGQLARMQKLGIAENDIFKETEELKKAFVLRTAIGNLDLEAEKNNLSQVFEQVKSKAALTDATLVNVIGAEQQKALQGLENIEKRLMKALKQRNETELNQLEKLKQQLFPENILQERYDNFSSYYAAHGSSFIEGLIRELDPYQKEFLLIEE
jgi:bacillithiol biosynthesis cysteine-adding enzyme BshC